MELCKICNKPVLPADRICYTDLQRNLKDDHVHYECYIKNVYRYFPDSLLVKRLKIKRGD